MPTVLVPTPLRRLTANQAKVDVAGDTVDALLHNLDDAYPLAREIVASEPARYFYPDQYNNDSNWRAHYDTTGLEILCQTNSRVTHFVAGLGTTGTFMGVGRRLKEANPAIQLVAIQPADEPYAPASLFEEGFIHLSATPEQVAWVAHRFYADIVDLVTLVIDETRLDAPVRWDDTPDRRFPHLYGPLNREAIVDIAPVPRNA